MIQHSPELYQEILKDYEYRFSKFHPIPSYHEQTSNAKIARTKYQSLRINRGRK